MAFASDSQDTLLCLLLLLLLKNQKEIHLIPPTRSCQHQKRSHPRPQGSKKVVSCCSCQSLNLGSWSVKRGLSWYWRLSVWMSDLCSLQTSWWNSDVIQVSQKGEGQCKHGFWVVLPHHSLVCMAVLGCVINRLKVMLHSYFSNLSDYQTDMED